jgi:DNA helicase IV
VTAHRAATEAVVAREIAIEQAHVDRVYAELAKAAARADTVAADGLARGRTDRTGDIRDEEITGLFERDALMYAAARRRHTIDQQYEGLVFGRLDLEHATEGGAREVRHVGRLGVRDDDYEPLVVDWRAPAAAAFYRATPVEPMGVIRRRVLRKHRQSGGGSGNRDCIADGLPDETVSIH